MITSADNRSRQGDVSLGDTYRNAGLPIPSVVRTTKIATIESHRAERLGQIAPDLFDEVMRQVGIMLGRMPRTDPVFWT